MFTLFGTERSSSSLQFVFKQVFVLCVVIYYSYILWLQLPVIAWRQIVKSPNVCKNIQFFMFILSLQIIKCSDIISKIWIPFHHQMIIPIFKYWFQYSITSTTNEYLNIYFSKLIYFGLVKSFIRGLLPGARSTAA